MCVFLFFELNPSIRKKKSEFKDKETFSVYTVGGGSHRCMFKILF